MFELTPLTTLLLFVGLLTTGFLIEAIRYWQAFRLHDRAWKDGPWYLAGSHAMPDHPDLIVENLSDIERRIIADAMYRGEDLPGVGPSFAE